MYAKADAIRDAVVSDSKEHTSELHTSIERMRSNLIDASKHVSMGLVIYQPGCLCEIMRIDVGGDDL